MKITQEDIVERQAVLHIELEEEDLEKYLDRAYRRVVQRANIPGFRKGKAPRSILERFVGRDTLLSEALDFLLPDATAKAIEEQKLDTSGIPKMEVVDLEPRVQIKATVPLTPLVELGSYRDIRLSEEPVEVTEERVQEILERIRNALAPWEPVDRAVEMGDMLSLNVTGNVDGREVLDEADTVYIPAEDNDRPFPGFSEQLVGISKGQSKDFSLTIPSDYPSADMAGRECQFSALVTEIKERKLPEMNDEFAKGVGEGYETLEALRQKVRDDLKVQLETEALSRYRDNVVDMVVHGARLELSPLLIEHDIDHILADREEALNQRRISMDQYLATVGKTQEQLREEVREVSTSRLTRSLVLSKVAELEGIDVSPDEVDARIETLSRSPEEGQPDISRLFDSEESKESLRRVMLTQKVLDRLVEIARGQASEAVTSQADAPEETPDGEDEPNNGGSENATQT